MSGAAARSMAAACGKPDDGRGLVCGNAMGRPTLVFMHGWGFDAAFWQPLRAHLGAWPQHAADSGYYTGSPACTALPEGPLVMIGHSFGYMQALQRMPGQVLAWVSINGFPRFCAAGDFRHGVAPRLLQRMAARLDASPVAVVDEFRRRCGAGPAPGAPIYGPLARDLAAMQSLDLRAEQRGQAASLLVLAGEQDPIVPAAMMRDAFAGRNIDWLPDGGHLLPATRPAWCAARITAFLIRLGLAPTCGNVVGHQPTPMRCKTGEQTSAPTSTQDNAARQAPISTRGRTVGVCFGAAARTYERHAGVQHEVASRLTAQIAALDLPARPRILEIGCGTGLFTRRLAAHFPQADWTITDLSADMLAQAQQGVRLGGSAHFHVMDGESPTPSEMTRGFDLICSSMALQWFRDAGQGLERLAGLLSPGGWLAVAVPVQGTFAEWRRAHDAEGLSPSMIAFPRARALCLQGKEGRGSIRVERIVQDCGSALRFLRDLKGIGAVAPRAGSCPLSVARLRRVCARFEQAGARCSYRIAYSLWCRGLDKGQV